MKYICRVSLFLIFSLSFAALGAGDEELAMAVDANDTSAVIDALRQKPSKDAAQSALDVAWQRGSRDVVLLIFAYMPALYGPFSEHQLQQGNPNQTLRNLLSLYYSLSTVVTRGRITSERAYAAILSYGDDMTLRDWLELIEAGSQQEQKNEESAASEVSAQGAVPVQVRNVNANATTTTTTQTKGALCSFCMIL